MNRRRIARLLVVAWVIGCAGNPPPPLTEPSPPAVVASPEVQAAAATAAAAIATMKVPQPEADKLHQINAPFRNLATPADVQGWVEKFEGESREIWRKRDAIVTAMKLEPGQRVADVGAGTGLFEPLFARAVGEKGKVFAVDIAQPFLDRIAKNAADQGFANIETIHCDETSTQLAAGSVDLVFICDTYHHFEHWTDTLASIHAALAPSGRLVIVDFVRTPGVTRDWILNHVRAGQETVTAEITAAGFTLDREEKLLEENYFLVFVRKP